MTHQLQLENEKYRQWVKAGLGLGYLKEGLTSFCNDIAYQQHKDILQNIRSTKSLQSIVTCGSCRVETLKPDHKPVPGNAGNNVCPFGQVKCSCCFPKVKIACPNNICGAIYDYIVQQHASSPPSPYWKNSDAQQWTTDPWSICKCFINAPGYEDRQSASATDSTGLLHVLINNQYFHSHIGCNVTETNNLLSKVRQYRNTIFHSSSMELDESEANMYIDDMIAVLQDSRELLQRSDTQIAVKKLQDLKKKDLIVTTEDFKETLRQIQEELAKVQKLAEKSPTKEEYEELKNKLETQMSKLKEEIKRLKEDDSPQQKHIEYEKAKSAWRKKLIDHYYKNLLQVPTTPVQPQSEKCSFNEIYIRPKIKMEMKEGKGETMEVEVKTMSEIFTKNGIPQKSVYVVGDAGSGKTSFCKYLVNCWCLAHSEKLEDEIENEDGHNKHRGDIGNEKVTEEHDGDFDYKESKEKNRGGNENEEGNDKHREHVIDVVNEEVTEKHGGDNEAHGGDNETHGGDNDEHEGDNETHGGDNKQQKCDNEKHEHNNEEHGGENEEHRGDSEKHGPGKEEQLGGSEKHDSDSEEHAGENEEQRSDNEEHGGDSEEHGSDNKEHGKDSDHHECDSEKYGGGNEEHEGDSGKKRSDSKRHGGDIDGHESQKEEHGGNSEKHCGVKEEQEAVNEDNGGDSKEHIGENEEEIVENDEHRCDSEEHEGDIKEHGGDTETHGGDKGEQLGDSEEHGGDNEKHGIDSEKHGHDYEKHGGYIEKHRSDKENQVGDNAEHVGDQEKHGVDNEKHGRDNEKHGGYIVKHCSDKEDQVVDNEEHRGDSEEHGGDSEKHVYGNEEKGGDYEEHGVDNEEHGVGKEDHEGDSEKRGGDTEEHGGKNEEHSVVDNDDNGGDSGEHRGEIEDHGGDSEKHGSDKKKQVSDNEEHEGCSEDYGGDSEKHFCDSVTHGSDNEEQVGDNEEHGGDNEEHGVENEDHGGDSEKHTGDKEEQVGDTEEHGCDTKEHGVDNEEHGVGKEDHEGDSEKRGGDTEEYGGKNEEHRVDNEDNGGDSEEYGGENEDHGGESEKHGGDKEKQIGDIEEHGDDSEEYEGGSEKNFSDNVIHGSDKEEQEGDNEEHRVDTKEHGGENEEHRIDNDKHECDSENHESDMETQVGDNKDHVIDSAEHKGDIDKRLGDNEEHGDEKETHGGDSEKHGVDNEEQVGGNEEHGGDRKKYGGNNEEQRGDNEEHGGDCEEHGDDNKGHEGDSEKHGGDKENQEGDNKKHGYDREDNGIDSEGHGDDNEEHRGDREKHGHDNENHGGETEKHRSDKKEQVDYIEKHGCDNEEHDGNSEEHGGENEGHGSDNEKHEYDSGKHGIDIEKHGGDCWKHRVDNDEQDCDSEKHFGESVEYGDGYEEHSDANEEHEAGREKQGCGNEKHLGDNEEHGFVSAKHEDDCEEQRGNNKENEGDNEEHGADRETHGGESEKHWGDNEENGGDKKQREKNNKMWAEYTLNLIRHHIGLCGTKTMEIEDMDYIVEELGYDSKTYEEEFMGVKEMKKFEFVFYIPLRQYHNNDTIDEMLYKWYEMEILSTLLKEESSRVMILLDGIDEWSSENVPEHSKLKEYTIVTTSRPWKFYTLRSSGVDIKQSLKLKGFDSKCEREMVNRTVSQLNIRKHANKDARDCRAKLGEKSLGSLKQVPIILQQLICLWYDDKLDKTSRCAIYTGMLELFFTWNDMKTARTINRYIKGDKKVNLPKYLADKTKLQLNRHFIYDMSQLAYETLFNCPKNKSLAFDICLLDELDISDEVRENCLKLGIMTEDERPNFTVSEPSSSLFSFIHKSMQEFLAVVNICINFYTKIASSNSTGNDELAKSCYQFIKGVFQKCSSVNEILEQSSVMIMLCGLEPKIATHVSKYIFDTVSKDSRVKEYRRTVNTQIPNDLSYTDSESRNNNILFTDIHQLVFALIEECKESSTPALYLGDLIIDELNQFCDNVYSRIKKKEIATDSVRSIRVSYSNTDYVKFTRYLPKFRHLEKLDITYQLQLQKQFLFGINNVKFDYLTHFGKSHQSFSSTQNDSTVQRNTQMIDEINKCTSKIIKRNTLTLKSLSLSFGCMSLNDISGQYRNYYPVCRTVVRNLPCMNNLVAIRMSYIIMSHDDTTTFCNFLAGTSNLDQIHLHEVKCDYFNQHDVNLSSCLKYLYLCNAVNVIDVDTTNLEIFRYTDLKRCNYKNIFEIIRKSNKLKELELHADWDSQSHLYHTMIGESLVKVQNLRMLRLHNFRLNKNIIQSPLQMNSLNDIELHDVIMTLTTWQKFVDSLPSIPHTVNVKVFKCCIIDDGEIESNDDRFVFLGQNSPFIGSKGNDAKQYVKDQDKLFHFKHDGIFVCLHSSFDFSTKK